MNPSKYGSVPQNILDTEMFSEEEDYITIADLIDNVVEGDIVFCTVVLDEDDHTIISSMDISDSLGHNYKLVQTSFASFFEESI